MWQDLENELGEWAAAGRTATFWWRDDDAVEPTPALDRLAVLSDEAAVPCALAVIPKLLAPKLPRALAGHPLVRVIQHGYAHQNHAPPGGRGWELGLHRPSAVVLDELSAGRRALADAFDGAFVPALAPPWNRIDPALYPDLPGIGLCGVSTFRDRARREPAAGLVEVNTHFDLIDWREGRVFRGEAAAGRHIVGHLRRRRLGLADAEEPTGILTHHLATDEAGWRFLAEFMRFIERQKAARWADPATLFS
jgi:hypothetical protein